MVAALHLGAAGSRAAEIQVPSAGYPTLQSALQTAPDNSLVLVAPGTYREALNANTLKKTLYFRSSGGAGVTIIDGENVRTLLYVINGPSGSSSKNLTFDGFTFKRGRGAATTSPVTIADASPQFINCEFRDNSAPEKGGAVLAYSIYSIRTAPLFLNCLFQGNRSDQWGGAALIGNGGVMTTPHVEAYFKDCRFLGNTTRTGVSSTSQGGALVFATAGGKIVNCEFDGNTATYAGGAISAYTMFTDGSGRYNTADTLEIQGSVFNGNYCNPTVLRPTEGGAIHAEANLTVKVRGTVFTGNYADASGALNSYRANLEVTNCVFDGNQAVGTGGLGFAGAIGMNNNDVGDADRREASLTVAGTLIRNSLAPVGGGIYASGDETYTALATVTLSNTTIENCRATTAGGSLGHGGGLFFQRIAGSGSNLQVLNNTAEGFGGAFVINLSGSLSLNNSNVIGNTAAVNAEIHNPNGLSYSKSGTTVAYNNGVGTADLALLSAIPPVTLRGTGYLTQIVAPYGSPDPAIDQGVGTPPRRGSNPNYYASGTASAAGILADTLFTLTSAGHTNKTATVTYAPNGVTGIPYLGAPVSLPGKIEAENFDNGGEGVAYHDLDLTNYGGGYRTGEGVDIFPLAELSNGFGVGWVGAGEWLEYSVNVAAGGCHRLDLRAASPSGGRFALQLDGADLSGVQSVPNTGGWTAWQTVSVSGVALTAGAHRLRLIVLDGTWNLDYLELAALGNTPPVARAGGPYTTIENVARTLRAGQSSDPDQGCGDAITKYEWDLNNDSVFSQYAVDATLTWSQIVAEICGGGCTAGVPYPITLRVTDGSALTDTDSTTFTVVPKLPAPNDFDGDGKSDFGAYDPPAGAWTIYKSSEAEPYRTNFGYAGTFPVSGDFDADGKSDFGAYFPPLGKWYLFRSTLGFLEDAFGYAGTHPVVGDFDGDGQSDFGCYYPPLGKWYLFRSTLGFLEDAFGYAGTLPVVGDFDGDGQSDIGCYYPPGGNWYVFKSTLGFWQTTFGYAGTLPVVGDFDGDGKSDIGCYYPPGGNWYFFTSSNGFSQTTFGFAGTEPVIGDFDGDGRSDFGVYYDQTGDLYLFQSRDGYLETRYGFIGGYALGGRSMK